MSDTINFGIDLGTTNSSIACCEAGAVNLFNSPEGSPTTPSVVYIGEGGRLLVGQRAYDVWVQDPRNTQAEFKRWMGYNDRLAFPASGKQLSAEELSAEVLKALRADVQRTTNQIVRASVITVPAAFGSLQCEATSRAAKLAGLQEAPLLQEPIAAAIAYGAARGSEDQRWMVFDLGGGTLDIAIVSTRNGQLTVLEHQGNNRLGSKDMDRVIAQNLLLKPLSNSFALPDAKSNPSHYERLMRALIRQAEKVKIALSTKDSVDVELSDIGNDAQGKSIELKLTLTRQQVEEQVRPLVDKCIQLAKSALTGARTTGANLDRILLVGGPTQMPIIRAALQSEIGAKLDCSQDPMTVVARGAALYASTIQITVAELTEAPLKAGTATPPKAPPSSATQITLSYERASGTVQSPLAGILPDGSPIHEIKIDAESGLWTSGWIAVRGGMFETHVMLDNTKPITRFLLSARDKSGNALPVSPKDFSIAYMLPIAAPPLPHTIAIELATNSGISTFDTVFKRHSPLPAEVRKTYRSDRTIRPSETNSSLPIKFWEIEVSDDPQEKLWAGAVHIRADRIRRPIPEGSDLELTVKIDQSRKMTVEVFVPLLNQSFVEGVYIPDPPSARSQVQQQFDLCFDRMEHVERLIYELDREDVREHAAQVRKSLENLFEEANTRRQSEMTDPDAEMEAADGLKRIRLQLTQLEEQLESAEMQSAEVREMRGQAKFTQHVVANLGNPSQHAELTQLSEQMNRYIESEDHRGLAWVRAQMIELRAIILDAQPWYWQNVLAWLKRPERRFANRAQAEIWLKRAEEAERSQHLPALRDAVIKVWEMQPPDQVELSKQQAAQSGLRPV